MNRERRKQIAAARVLIDKGKALLDEARDMLETVKDDEQAARENLPPRLEDSERAQAMDAAVSELESAISALEDFDAEDRKSGVPGKIVSVRVDSGGRIIFIKKITR